MSSIEYVAGFFDGEGSVGLYASRSSGRFSMRVCVNQVIGPASTVLFDELKARWGGSFAYPKRAKSQHRQAISWTLYGDRGADFLEALLPFLQIKKESVSLVLTWQREFGSSRIHSPSPERATQRAARAREIMARLDVLKAKGPKRKANP